MFSGRMAALIYRGYEFNKLVSVRKMCQFGHAFEIEIFSNGTNAMKFISVTTEIDYNVLLTSVFKAALFFLSLFWASMHVHTSPKLNIH